MVSRCGADRSAGSGWDLDGLSLSTVSMDIVALTSPLGELATATGSSASSSSSSSSSSASLSICAAGVVGVGVGGADSLLWAASIGWRQRRQLMSTSHWAFLLPLRRSVTVRRGVPVSVVRSASNAENAGSLLFLVAGDFSFPFDVCAFMCSSNASRIACSSRQLA
jgi:hypothetical protein